MIRIVIKHNRIDALRPDDVDASGARAKKTARRHTHEHTQRHVCYAIFSSVENRPSTRPREHDSAIAMVVTHTNLLILVFQPKASVRLPNNSTQTISRTTMLLFALTCCVCSSRDCPSSPSSLFVYAINALMQMQTHSPLLLLRKRVCVTNINIRLPCRRRRRRRGSCPQKRIDSDSC